MSIETISNAVLRRAGGPAPGGDPVGIFQHLHVVVGRADGADDAFADAGDDRFFGRPADQLLQVRPHRDAGPHLELNAVLGHGVERCLPPRPGSR